MSENSEKDIRTISSSVAVFWKFIFSTVWISGFGLGTLATWISGRTASEPLQLGGVWILGTVFILALCGGLKRVRIDTRQLYVSNYFREISIPISTITDVRYDIFLNPHRVAIHFRPATAFGSKIKFIPEDSPMWSVPPIVAELTKLAGIPR
jgi:hypothetical protein